MIKLTKVEEPDILRISGMAWLENLKAFVAADDKKAADAERGKYNHKEIKDRLVVETHGKCAYCESKILHIAYGDIEHIAPKSSDINLTFRWSNLTLACPICNRKKWAHDGILDPYSEEPSDHFLFMGPMVFPRSNSPIAIYTETKLKLNRIELVEQRVIRLQSINRQLQIICNTLDVDLKKVLIDDLVENECGKFSEFSAFCKAFVSTVMPEIIFP